jgi:hypothetical protein
MSRYIFDTLDILNILDTLDILDTLELIKGIKGIKGVNIICRIADTLGEFKHYFLRFNFTMDLI